MADTAALPAVVARLSPRTGAPVNAIVVTATAAVAFALAGDLTFIASVTDFAVYVVFLAVNTAVIVLRRCQPDTPRPFRTPGATRGIPIIPVAGSVAALVMVPQLSASSLVLGVVLLVFGLVAYRFLDRAGSSPPIEPARKDARL
jgi:APA family basic amino acid/polyamine antiporter